MARLTRATSSEPSAIGVFDSGLGGLTVVRELQRLLPNESIVYLGDTARVPYGTRATSTVKRYARGCADLLRQRNIKCLVIACNTVSAVAIEPLQEQLGLPVIGVIEPGAQAAVEAIRQQQSQGVQHPKVGVLGTAGTIRSGAYSRAVHRSLPQIEVVERTAPLLVPLVEEGWLTGEVPTLAVERYVQPMVEAGVTVLVLGCTHYPLLVPVLAEVTQRLSPLPIQMVDGARACAQAVSLCLLSEDLTSKGLIAQGLAATSLPATNASSPKNPKPPEASLLTLLATDMPDSFLASARRFLGEAILDVHQVDIVPSVASDGEALAPKA